VQLPDDALIAHGEMSLGYREVPPLCQLDQLAQTPKWDEKISVQPFDEALDQMPPSLPTH